MGIQTQFKKFHDKIKLSREDKSYRKARNRDDSISEDVKKSFKEADYPVIEQFIQGLTREVYVYRCDTSDG